MSRAPLDRLTPKREQAYSGDPSAKKAGSKDNVNQVTKQLGKYEEMLKQPSVSVFNNFSDTI